MDKQILSVSEFHALVNQTLEFAYPLVTIEGEISEYSVKQEKWIRFKLKDTQNAINCFATTFQIKAELEDGMKVRVTGTPQLKSWGELSFQVRSIEPAGEGAMRRAFELMRAKLEAEGLFAPKRKRAIPRIPTTIGLITSTESAAYQDFLKILNTRWSGVNVMVAPVQVQGKPAEAQIIGALDYFNQLTLPPDVLVLTRGGGGLEDLQTFNLESVARAVARSRTPIIVGIGHEVDVTLAELAADERAATPTDAARRVVPDKSEVTSMVNYQLRQLHTVMARMIEQHQAVISHYQAGLEQFIHIPRQQLKVLESELLAQAKNMSDSVNYAKNNLVRLHQTLVISTKQQIEYSKREVISNYRNLSNMDPRAVLARGYAVARVGGSIVRGSRDVKVGDTLMLQLAKAELITEVKDVESVE